MTRSIHSDLSFILSNLREGDQREIDALLGSATPVPAVVQMVAQSWLQSQFKRMVYGRDGQPIAFICFNAYTATSLQVSMLSTARWKEATRPLIRWGLKYFKPQALRRGYRRVECRTIVGNSDAIHFLEGLGFRLECRVLDYGLHDEVFLQYAWRASDHVPFPENPEA
jgi:hypothetical protein